MTAERVDDGNLCEDCRHSAIDIRSFDSVRWINVGRGSADGRLPHCRHLGPSHFLHPPGSLHCRHRGRCSATEGKRPSGSPHFRHPRALVPRIHSRCCLPREGRMGPRVKSSKRVDNVNARENRRHPRSRKSTPPGLYWRVRLSLLQMRPPMTQPESESVAPVAVALPL